MKLSLLKIDLVVQTVGIKSSDEITLMSFEKKSFKKKTLGISDSKHSDYMCFLTEHSDLPHWHSKSSDPRWGIIAADWVSNSQAHVLKFFFNLAGGKGGHAFQFACNAAHIIKEDMLWEKEMVNLEEL